VRRSNRLRVAEAPRFSSLKVSGFLTDDVIGSLSGVQVIGGQVFCRWRVGTGRYLVTTSSKDGSTAPVISAHADGEAIFLLGVKGDAVGPCAPLHGAPNGAGHGARQVGRARRNRPEITQ